MTSRASGKAVGRLALGFARVGDRSRLKHVEEQAPLRALFPMGEPGEAPEAVIVNTGGGVVGGDSYAVDVTVEDGAALTLTTPAAEKIYRATGPEAVVVNRLHCGREATLEWLPQETILYDGAALRRRLDVSLDESSRFIGVETTLFGRQARGERFGQGLFFDGWTIRLGRKPIWADAFGLNETRLARAAPFGLGNAQACATLVIAGPNAAASLDVARDLAAACGSTGGATVVNGILLMRLLDDDAARLRAAVVGALSALRPTATGGRGGPPRLWLN